MNTVYLYYYTKVVDLKSISKAAKIEHISQSALTQIIQKIESELGCTLLLRNNKGVEPTKYGHIVYEYTKNISNTYDAMKHKIYCVDCDCQEINLKTCYTLNNRISGHFLFKLQKQFDNIKFTVSADCKTNIINEIDHGVCDYGLIMDTLKEQKGFAVSLLGYEHIVLISGIDYTKEFDMTVEDLRNYDIFDYPIGSYTQLVKKKLTKLLKNKEDLYSPTLNIDSLVAIKSLVESNHGLAFLPVSLVVDELKSNTLKIINLKDFALKLPISFVSKNNQTQSSLKFQLEDIISSQLIENLSEI